MCFTKGTDHRAIKWAKGRPEGTGEPGDLSLALLDDDEVEHLTEQPNAVSVRPTASTDDIHLCTCRDTELKAEGLPMAQ